MKKPVISDAMANAFHTFARTLPRANGVRAFDGMIIPAVVRTCGGTRRRRNGRLTVREQQSLMAHKAWLKNVTSWTWVMR